MATSDEDVPAEFLAAAETFIAAAAARRAGLPSAAQPDRVALFPDLTPEQEQAELEAARAWRRERFDAGFGWLSGPPEYGGAGLSAAHERAYLRLERARTFPAQRVYDIGLGMVAPAILAFGSDAAKARYLRALHRGDILGCQLFSEPGAGSDLASISTRAQRHGDVWIVNGQKVWSSGAPLSDVGLLVCRTGEPEARHRNLTAFVLPMHAQGVAVRPIRQMTGGASFNEVFLDEVRIPDELRLG